MNRFKILAAVFAALVMGLGFYSCVKDIDKVHIDLNSENIFSNNEIDQMKEWLLNTAETGIDDIDKKLIPNVSFKFPNRVSDEQTVGKYFKFISHINRTLAYKQESAISIINIKEMLFNDSNLNDYDKYVVRSMIEMHEKVFSPINSLTIYKTERTGLRMDVCDCRGALEAYTQSLLLCNSLTSTGLAWCAQSISDFQAYLACLSQQPCPPGFVFDGANCILDGHWAPEGYTPFTLGNAFYVKPNCNISTEDNCCPPGYDFDGANCMYSDFWFPPNFQAFVLNNGYYVRPSCKVLCDKCPPGFGYDGANCIFLATGVPAGYQPFTLGGAFYVKRNCSISTANNCCPSGFDFDGANCIYSNYWIPSGWEAFVYQGGYYVKAKCK